MSSSVRLLAQAHDNRGAELYRRRRFAEALAEFEQAIEADPSYGAAHRNRGKVLSRTTGRFAEALASLDRALAIQPRDPVALLERAHTLMRMNRLEEAQAELDAIITLCPRHALSHFDKALCKLALGDYKEGFALFEWRWKVLGVDPVPKYGGLPLWLGESPIEGKRLLVPREQGFGDLIQFCRFVPGLEAMGATVVLLVPAVTFPLLRTLSPTVILAEFGSPPPACDCVCPIASLPLAFRSTVASVAERTPYLFVDPDRASLWRKRLGPRTRIRVGLAWSGNPRNTEDARRSISLSQLQPLLGLPAEFHVVQRDISDEDRAALSHLPNLHVHPIEDFGDAGALLDAMDLVISVDTAAAHVAGALAKRAWILLSFSSHWPWMLGRPDTPWYPSATLFRQPSHGDWPTVIREISERLRGEMDGASTASRAP